MTEPELKKRQVNGVELAYFERGTADAKKPTLFFVHATGFHGRLWDRIIEAFPEHHSIALEQRGHGRSESVAVTNWETFVEDQTAFVHALRLQNLIGIGHSMGGFGLVGAAAASGGFNRLLLLDPTIASPEAYAGSPPPDFSGELHPASKRRAVFETPQAMIDQLAMKSSFPLFEPRVLRDYCEYGLEKTTAGDYRLLCDPRVEAHVYMSARSHGGIYAAVRSLDIPVHILRARLPNTDMEMDFSSSPTWPGLAAEFKQGRDEHLPQLSHFIPMQAPDLVIEALREEVAAWA